MLFRATFSILQSTSPQHLPFTLLSYHPSPHYAGSENLHQSPALQSAVKYNCIIFRIINTYSSSLIALQLAVLDVIDVRIWPFYQSTVRSFVDSINVAHFNHTRGLVILNIVIQNASLKIRISTEHNQTI